MRCEKAPPPAKLRRKKRLATVAAAAALLFARAAEAGAPFDVQHDTFAFANETAWNYEIDPEGTLHIGRRAEPAKYAHRCFVMARAVLQFRQFARFAPERPRVSPAEYARLIRKISRIPVWSRGPRERLVVPGFRDLRSFSEAHAPLLQQHLGAWLPTYLRVGNYRMAMGHPRRGQAGAARWLAESMSAGKPRAVYLARFPKMNHCVVVYAAERRANGNIRFLVYDPNYPAEPARLDYLAAERSFSLEKRWYFPGGRVNLMRIYISPLH